MQLADYRGFGRTEQRFGQRRRACRSPGARLACDHNPGGKQTAGPGGRPDVRLLLADCYVRRDRWRCSRFAGAARNSFAADPLACPRQALSGGTTAGILKRDIIFVPADIRLGRAAARLLPPEWLQAACNNPRDLCSRRASSPRTGTPGGSCARRCARCLCP